jgi:transcriptional regulator of arginine metabolism
MVDIKHQRRSLILRLVSGEKIANQGQLLGRLEDHGIRTTQATVSRDIRDLGLIKVADSPGAYRYVQRREPAGWGVQVAEGVVVRVDATGNLIVVRTRAGFAQSVAAAVDGLNWPELLGTVGGDDTVLVVLRDPREAAAVLDRLRSLFSLEGEE